MSDLGFEQCKELRETLKKTLPGRLDPDLVLVSPMTRTLQTALASLDWLQSEDSTTNKKSVPFVAHAGWQETTDNPCDWGVEIDQVSPSFPTVDFSKVDPIFPEKKTPEAKLYHYNRNALVARAQTVLAELYARPEKVVAVVSHSAFLSKAVSGSMYQNADFRIFDFAEPVAVDSPAAKSAAHPDLPPLVYQLREWDETRTGHGGMGWSDDLVRNIGDELVD